MQDPTSLEKTRPGRSQRLDDFQPIRILRGEAARDERKRQQRKQRVLFTILALLLAYFVAPLRTNILLLGTDDSPQRGEFGRTDTIQLITVVPLLPYVGMLGIPRDLWVPIPGIGEQRINTAYFFAEAAQPGSGPRAAVETVRQNFGVTVSYFIVVHMTGLVDVIDGLGGIDIILDRAQGGLPAGTHHLDGTQALAFVRERYSADDFSRMQQGQILILATFRQAIRPGNWTRIPGALLAFSNIVETNIPIWQWPRLGFALLRTPLFGIDARTITREMVTPFQTSGGAQVLAPNWEAINPLLREMFGQ